MSSALKELKLWKSYLHLFLNYISSYTLWYQQTREENGQIIASGTLSVKFFNIRVAGVQWPKSSTWSMSHCSSFALSHAKTLALWHNITLHWSCSYLCRCSPPKGLISNQHQTCSNPSKRRYGILMCKPSPNFETTFDRKPKTTSISASGLGSPRSRGRSE